MLRTNAPRAIRLLRRRRASRQSDLAARASVSRATVSRLERGMLRSVSFRTLSDLVAALDASMDVTVRWQGEQLDRLIDSGHAAIVQACAAELADAGWSTRAEVSFNHYGDRGRVDLVGYHAPTRTLLVVEVKTAIGDVQEMLGRLDVKARLGRVVGESVGLTDVRAVIPVIVIADSRRARRVVADHPNLFARFRQRGRSARAWVRHPRPPIPSGLLWWTTVADSHGVTVMRGRRVRTGSIPA